MIVVRANRPHVDLRQFCPAPVAGLNDSLRAARIAQRNTVWTLTPLNISPRATD